MDYPQLALVAAAIALVAFLYSSVGHGGASGYIATLALCGFATVHIKPTALVLNILVACIGTFQFWRAGHFSWSLFWPFALLSVLLGAVLFLSAAQLFCREDDPSPVTPPTHAAAMSVGAGIGLLSGLTGTGGGVFLTPLLLLCRWANTRPAAAISALFILVNSIAGLVGYSSSGRPIPAVAWLFGMAATVGAMTGSYLGSRHFPARTVSLLLAVVLVIAGSKLILAT
jgi:uncharacterized membrane protein YfcA